MRNTPARPPRGQMSTPPVSPVETPPTKNANRIPAALGFVADAAGVVAFVLAGVKVIALVLGVVAVLFGVYLIASRWGRPFRLAALGAVVKGPSHRLAIR